MKVPGEKRGVAWGRENARTVRGAEGYIVVGRDAVSAESRFLGCAVVPDCWIGRTPPSSGHSTPGASIGDGAYLEDCIVGHGYDVRPGETIRGGALMRRAL